MKLSESQQNVLCTLLEYEGNSFDGSLPQERNYGELNYRTVASLVKKGLVTFESGPNHAGRYFGKITITDKGLKAINDNAEPEEGDLVKYLRFERPPRLGEKVGWVHYCEADSTQESFTGRIELETPSGAFFIAIGTASVNLMTNATLYARVNKEQVQILPKT